VTHNEIQALLLKLLGNVAPDLELGRVDPSRNLRAQVDIDSMDFLNFLIAVDRAFHVAVPEADYGRLTSLEDITRYIEEHVASGAPSVGN
jgi:acyl carrier protein